jgi:hypothetical protein
LTVEYHKCLACQNIKHVGFSYVEQRLICSLASGIVMTSSINMNEARPDEERGGLARGYYVNSIYMVG